MKAYGGVKVQLHSFLTLKLDWPGNYWIWAGWILELVQRLWKRKGL